MRPANFELDYSHPLARGLVFAGLGNAAGGNRYHDSSTHRNPADGASTFDPTTDWVWSQELRRWTILGNFTSEQHVIATPAPVLVEPLTMVCWCKPESASEASIPFAMGDTGGISGCFRIAYRGDQAGDPFDATKISTGGTEGNAFSPAGKGLAWQHVAGTFSSTTSRTCWLNGVAGSEDTTSASDAGVDNITVGALQRSSLMYGFTGLIADAMAWNRILSATELSELADPSNVMLSGMLKEPGRIGDIYNLEGVR